METCRYDMDLLQWQGPFLLLATFLYGINNENSS